MRRAVASDCFGDARDGSLDGVRQPARRHRNDQRNDNDRKDQRVFDENLTTLARQRAERSHHQASEVVSCGLDLHLRQRVQLQRPALKTQTTGLN
jgi:hypothetical protein